MGGNIMFTENATRIGTLGNHVDDATCSIMAAKSINEPVIIVPFKEFELIVDPLINGCVDAMLVPGADPFITKFIMNDRLYVQNVFTYIIPSLVFASKHPESKSEYETLFNHPATNVLIGDLDIKWLNQINVSSNSEACLNVLQNVDECSAITNSASAQQHGLYIHKVLRDSINMPFVIFVKNKGGIEHE